MGPTVNHLIASYGYLALALVVGLESIGLPLPGETALIAASVYAGITGHLRLGAVMGVAAGAAFVGDQTGFLIGRTGGQWMLRRVRGRSPRWNRNVAALEGLILLGGGRLVILARFVSVMRTYVSVVAGAGPMSWRRFAAANAAGVALWSTSLGTVAYVTADATRHATLLPAAVGVALAVAAAGGGVLLSRRLLARAQTAPEDPKGRPPATREPRGTTGGVRT